MQRAAFVMKLKPGFEQEYKRRHDRLWPELAALLSRSGIRDYSIFLEQASGRLFAVQKLEGASSSQDLGSDPLVRRWWEYMADIMEVNPDKSPVIEPLTEVFHLD